MRTGWMWKPKSVVINAKNDTQNQGDDELIDLSAGKDSVHRILMMQGKKASRYLL